MLGEQSNRINPLGICLEVYESGVGISHTYHASLGKEDMLISTAYFYISAKPNTYIK